ncbi:uncharacterized protein PRCAT00001350001 [Priceomyces carsonii]|uniref:uncharacterized protein n=1 Tax=Priceomyces carsonii TaxID=28549 RepID=UPI002ED9E3E8|nr:unnamed protein product [Priceomyces carsonii]
MQKWGSLLAAAASITSALIIFKRLYDDFKTEPERLTLLPPKSRGIESLIGNTPLIEIKSLSSLTGCKIYAKMELFNPAGSAKDRVALSIIRENERLGRLKPGNGDIIFEGTSGSTGISFATLANALGYTAHICLPDDTSPEKIMLLRSLGAEIQLVKPASIVDPDQYTNIARRLADEINSNHDDPRNAIFADQFENEFNWKVHYSTTGPEIWKQMEHDISLFITGSGTGGTITGVSKFLKEQDENIKIILADPQGSGLANRINYGVMYDTVEKEGTRRRHQVDTIVEGIGLNRLTRNFKQGEGYIDEAIRVNDDEAAKMAKYLCLNDGIFWGPSAAVNCVAALKIAYQYGPGHKIVLIACDSGERHLSKFWKRAVNVSEDVTIDDILQEDC